MLNEPLRAGHTRVRTRALTRLAQYVGSETLELKPREVDAQVFDSHAKLGVALSTGIRDTDLEMCASRADTTLFTFADAKAKAFSEQMAKLSGCVIGDVNIRFTHIVETEAAERRVK